MALNNCDGLTCCLGCLSLVPGLRRRIVNRVAFFPPEPPGYWIDHPSCTTRDECLSSDWSSWCCQQADVKNPSASVCCENLPTFLWVGSYQPMPTIHHGPDASIRIETIHLHTAENNSIWAFFFQRADAQRTIIFSHGNSTDIGMIHSHLLDLCRILRANVLAYEYTGYGCSTGEASEQSLYKDIDAAFEFLVGPRSISPTNIILYGQSVGSAPTLDLAARVQVGGVILHAALKSGLSVLKDDATTGSHWFDAFKNVEKIRRVSSPVLVLHGTEDEEVRLEHGKALHEAAPNAVEPWWVSGAGHNDIEVHWRHEYFSKLQEFIMTVVELSPNNVSARSEFRSVVCSAEPKWTGHQTALETSEQIATRSSWRSGTTLKYKRNGEGSGDRHTSKRASQPSGLSSVADESCQSSKLLCSDKRDLWSPEIRLQRVPRKSTSTRYHTIQTGTLSPPGLALRRTGRSNSSR
eukprot:GHVS01081698.1.p1 GENE.GHVS01081698.1~~GHVS01081698.1.p1  ORF type:complete len:465 (-),score=35.47 GHVS01081698.1:761-2155(-)